ncbi:MAG: transposase, is4 family [Verrucomicrobiota bacterium]
MTSATGVTEPAVPTELLARQVDQAEHPPQTVGADKGYHNAELVSFCREHGIAPHVAQIKDREAKGLDGRTTRTLGYQPGYQNWYGVNSMATTVGATNLNAMMAGLIGRYAGVPQIYKCPADRALDRALGIPRVRSVSMNGYLGGQNNGQFYPNIQTSTYAKLTRLDGMLNPTERFVFLDEEPTGLNDGIFWVADPLPTATKFIDYPASYHNDSCGLSFADGHSETHRWIDKRTRTRNGADANSGVDTRWLITKTSE